MINDAQIVLGSYFVSRTFYANYIRTQGEGLSLVKVL